MEEKEVQQSLHSRTLNLLKERRQRIVDGYLNIIPSPFKRFSSDFPGIERSTYITVTSSTKGGKSQFVSHTFIFEPIWFCYHNQDKGMSLKVLYFPLEETQEKIMTRFYSWLLYKITGGRVRVSPTELRSTTYAVDEDILTTLESEKYKDIIEYFEQCVIFSEEITNPQELRNYCTQYAEDNGTTYYKDVSYIDSTTERQVNRKIFDRYEPDNPNEIVIVLIDTINLIETEKGYTIKESMDKISEYAAKYLRNRYHMTPIFIQQQAFSQESNDSIKLGRMKPTIAGLGDSKYTSRDSDLAIGLFSPFKFELAQYEGYNIVKFRDHIRFAEILINRNGEQGGVCPLFFDGAVSHFKELPLPSEPDKIDKVYNYLEVLEEQKQESNRRNSFFYRIAKRVIKTFKLKVKRI